MQSALQILVYYSYALYTIYININMHKSGYLSSNILESVVFNVKVEIISVYTVLLLIWEREGSMRKKYVILG